MATRKTYENRTQVDIPFSSVPIVSPTVTAGRGAVVGPAQVQPSKLVSLSNALGIATQATSTLTNIAELQKQQGLRAGKLAAEAEAEASLNAVNELEQRLISKGQLVESQSLAFRTGYNEIMGSRIGDEYGNKLRTRINEAITNDLSKDVDPEVYIKSIVDNEYQTYNEQLKNNPIALASFNKVARYKNNEFYSSTLKARNDNIVAVRNKEAVNHAATQLSFSITPEGFKAASEGFKSMHSDPLINEELQIKALTQVFGYLQGEGITAENNEQMKRALALMETTKGAKGKIPLSIIHSSDFSKLAAQQRQYQRRLNEKSIENVEEGINFFANASQLLENYIGLEDNPEEQDKAFRKLESYVEKQGGNLNNLINLIKVYKDSNDNLIEGAWEDVFPPQYSKAFLELRAGDEFDASISEVSPRLDPEQLKALKEVSRADGRDGRDFNASVFATAGGVQRLDKRDQTELFNANQEGKRLSVGTTKSPTGKKAIEFLRGFPSYKNAFLASLGKVPEYFRAEKEEQERYQKEIASTWDIQSQLLGSDLKDEFNEAITSNVNAFRADNPNREPTQKEIDTIISNTYKTFSTEVMQPRYKELANELLEDLPNVVDIPIDVSQVMEDANTINKQYKPVNIFAGDALRKNPAELTRADLLIARELGELRVKDNQEETNKYHMGFITPMHIPESELKNIDVNNVLLFEDSLIKGTSWDFDNENPAVHNILRSTLEEFEALGEGDVDTQSFYPQAKWFSKNLGINTLKKFERFLANQQSLAMVQAGIDAKKTPALMGSLRRQIEMKKLSEESEQRAKDVYNIRGGKTWYTQPFLKEYKKPIQQLPDAPKSILAPRSGLFGGGL